MFRATFKKTFIHINTQKITRSSSVSNSKPLLCRARITLAQSSIWLIICVWLPLTHVTEQLVPGKHFSKIQNFNSFKFISFCKTFQETELSTHDVSHVSSPRCKNHRHTFQYRPRFSLRLWKGDSHETDVKFSETANCHQNLHLWH